MTSRPGRRSIVTAAGFVAVGAVAGGVLASTLTAGADTTPSPSASPHAAPPGSTPAQPGPPHGPMGRGRGLSGTVTAVHANSDGTTGTVTIKTATGTTTYTVTKDSDIDKSGESQLSKLVAGDAVRFAVDGTTVRVLHAGDEAKDMPSGRPGGGPGRGPDGSPGGPGGGFRGGHGLGLSGTVTAVHANSDGTTGTVSIKTATGTTMYTVTKDSDIDKNGESQLSKLVAGDAVRFAVDGTTVRVLHAGDEAKDAPQPPPGMPRPGMPHPSPSASATA